MSGEVLGVEVWVVPKLAGNGFVVFVKRWVVDWLSGVCRLGRDYEVRVAGPASWLYER